MLLKKVFTGKERISLQFDIKVLSVLEIPSSKTNNNCGGNIFVEWKKGRGSKDHGQTRHCLLKAKDVEFNDLITFGTHVVRDPKSGACEPKPLVFSLKYSPTEDQRPKSLGEVTIDLGEFAKSPTYDEIRSYSFLRKKKEVRAMIELHIQSKWLKVDKKKYDSAAATNADGAETADGNDTSESELTHLSDSDINTSEMEDEDTDDNIQATEGAKSSSQQTPVKRKSSKRLSGDAAVVTNVVTTLPSITETGSSPRRKGSESDKDSDSSGKERSLPRKSSSRDHVSSKDSSKDKEKEKEKKKKKPRPFSADFSGLGLEVPTSATPAVDNKSARPLASHSSLGALALSPGGTGKLTHGGVPTLAKKQRRRSLEPNSDAAAALQAAIIAQNNLNASAAPSDPNALPSPASAAAAAVGIAAAPFDIPLHTEKKIQQEVEMAHEEVRSLRKELMAAQQKIRALEQDRQRLLQATSVLQMAQSTPPELALLQDKCSKQDAQLKQQETAILSLRAELARAKSAAVPWMQSRNDVPAIELPRIISKEDEKKLLMVFLLILSILSSCSFLFGTGSAAASTGETF